MPDRIEPALALFKAKRPKGPEWLFEVKWDDYRLAIHKSGDNFRVITRGGHKVPFRDEWAGNLEAGLNVSSGWQFRKKKD
ncbi:hypothetical protein BN77_1613 [Rhizobium mesoamericanum STM3625]|uniref:ATP-dependent DNA ligase family profile domain-containing protein n=1 Tax=Rhizobium mesoamericanum STM3625 TaxID=1211777 RepID=K0PKM7_9HYPH|nr:hypothetical protein BN77_1613 [Rhizobium mesoamericanum STM3625]